jgi:hypothetical protein
MQTGLLLTRLRTLPNVTLMKSEPDSVFLACYPHDLKHCLILGWRHSKPVAETMRQNGAAGREENDE